MAVLFHLIRHGSYPLLNQTLGGRGNYRLSEEGIQQAVRLGTALRDRGLAAVVSSPVERAVQTAQVIAEAAGLKVMPDSDFAEIDFASWSGRSFASLHDDPAWHAWNSFRGIARVPGGETMLQVQTRTWSALLRLSVDHAGREVAVVSHSDVIKAILLHVMGAPLDLMRRLEVGAGSISSVLLFDADAKVLGMNIPP